MPDVVSTPDWKAKQSREHHQLAPGHDHILDVEMVPGHSNIGGQEYSFKFFGNEVVEAWHDGEAYLTCFWIPFFDNDMAVMPTNWSRIKNIIDMRVPKVEDADPATALTQDVVASGETGAREDDDSKDDEGADKNLLYRPDRISQRVLEPAQVVMPYTPLYNRWIKFGLFDRNAYRTGQGDNCLYLHTDAGSIDVGFNTATPGAVVWILTIPPVQTDTNYKKDVVDPTTGGYDMTAATGGLSQYMQSWEEYEPLVPKRHPITGVFQYTDELGTINTFRKLALRRVGHYASGTPFYKQVNINVKFYRALIYRRNADTRQLVSAEG